VARPRRVAQPVQPLWPGSTVVCIAGGPSLTPADVDYCRGKARVLVINDGYRLAPWADVLYACDAKWWDRHDGVPSFEGLKFAMIEREYCKWSDIQMLGWSGEHGFEPDPSSLRSGRNSGHQAIQLAVKLGATRIVLLGYDMQPTGGQQHWFGSHPGKPIDADLFACWIRHARELVGPLKALGVNVINCTRQTALDAFPCQPLEAVL
jgi:hypothetical protein